MKRAPITKQRSAWDLVGDAELVPGWRCARFRRRVHDGLLVAYVGEEPAGWHLSISFRDHKGRHGRYPTCDEIAHARDELLGADRHFVMHLPPAGEYVAVHDTTFHLHELREGVR